MQKKYVFLLFSFLILNYIFCNNSDSLIFDLNQKFIQYNEESNARLLDLEIQYNNFIKTKINSELDNKLTINQIEEKIIKLNDIVNSMDIEYLNDQYDMVFNRWFLIQSILLGVLAGLGIILPLLTYLFAIKPAFDTEKRIKIIESNFEDLMTNRISEHLSNINQTQMKKAISDLLSTEDYERISAINYINLNQHIEINDDVRNETYNILTNKDTKENIKNPLRLLLSNKKSTWGDAYFKSVLLSNDEKLLKNLYAIAKYFCITEFVSAEEIIDRFTKSQNREIILMTFVQKLAEYSNTKTLELLNLDDYDGFLDYLTQYSSTMMLMLKTSYGIDSHETKYYKILEEKGLHTVQ